MAFKLNDDKIQARSCPKINSHLLGMGHRGASLLRYRLEIMGKVFSYQNYLISREFYEKHSKA